jgi:hypothetical protein
MAIGSPGGATVLLCWNIRKPPSRFDRTSAAASHANTRDGRPALAKSNPIRFEPNPGSKAAGEVRGEPSSAGHRDTIYRSRKNFAPARDAAGIV